MSNIEEDIIDIEAWDGDEEVGTTRLPAWAKASWFADTDGCTESFEAVAQKIHDLHQTLLIIQGESQNIAWGGKLSLAKEYSESEVLVRAILPSITIQELGDMTFCEDYSVDFPYMSGAMANGIASVELVEALAKHNILASYGAAGLQIDEIDQSIQRLKLSLGDLTFAANLIYTPNEVGHEDKVVDVFLKHNMRLAECSAYMKITLPAVRYRVAGIHEDDNGNIVTPNRIIAKASRIELASKWFAPPPEKLLAKLVENGDISAEQAKLATKIPMAQDLTVEADSGGHTDNRPAIALLPTILALRDQIQVKHQYSMPLRVGLGGGISTPASAAGAFAMGAAYIVTGTVNQACVESGSSDIVRKMLAEAEQADVTMAPAVDMFEMGVKLQVLKRGTMFAMRGNKLYDLYKSYDSIDAIPQKEREQIEKTIFREPLDSIWQKTQEFFNERDPKQVERALKDPKHKMALIFRWYLGLSSRWANAGIAERQVDYQVWMGPAMGAFNEWAKGSFLEQPENREAVAVAMNILYGAALQTRINSLQQQGVTLSAEQQSIIPMRLNEIEERLQ